MQNQFVQLWELAGAVQSAERSLNDRLAQVSSQLAAMTTGDCLASSRPEQAANGESRCSFNADGLPEPGMPWSVEKHILRKLEMTSDDLLGCVRDMRDGMASFRRRPGCDGSDGYRVSDVFRYLPQLAAGQGGTQCELRAMNMDDVLKSSLAYPDIFGIVTLWYTRTTYFTVILGTSRWDGMLAVYFKWSSTVGSPAAEPKKYSVTLVHCLDPRQNRAMDHDYRQNVFPLGCQHRFCTPISTIARSGLVDENTLTFHVVIAHESRR